LKNKTVTEVLEVEARGGGLEELLPLIGGKRGAEAWVTGDVEAAPMYVGQSIGLIHDVPSCEELLERMVSEAEERIISLKIDKFHLDVAVYLTLFCRNKPARHHHPFSP